MAISEQDLEALRAKYAPLAAKREEETVKEILYQHMRADSAAVKQLSLAKESDKPMGKPPVAAPGALLDGMRICLACQGSGIVDVIYNHMSIRKTCQKCEGEGVVAKALPGGGAGTVTASSVEVPAHGFQETTEGEPSDKGAAASEAVLTAGASEAAASLNEEVPDLE